MALTVPGTRLTRTGAALAALALAAVLCVPAVGAASPPPSAAPSPGSPAVSPAPSSDPAGVSRLERARARHPLLAGTVRADLTIVRRDGSTVVVHYEAGRITAVSATSITITGRDGAGATFAVTDATRVRRDGHPISVATLAVGDRAAAFGTGSGGRYTAFLIRSPKAVPAS